MEWNLELKGAEVLAVALAIACASLLLALLVLWKRPRTTPHDGATPELEALRRSVRQLESELGRLVQDMNGRIDAKMRILRGLLDGADAAIRQLRQLQLPPHSLAPHSELPGGAESSAETATQATPIAATAPARERLDSRSGVSDDALFEPTDGRTHRFSHIYSLADAGLDPARISAETGMHRGEVELVLNLRRKRVRLDRAGRPEPAHVVSHSEEATV